MVANYLEENDDEQITLQDLVEKMNEKCDSPYSTVYMKTKLLKHFGDSIIITEINGKQNVVTFRSNASTILQKFYERPKTRDPLEEKKEIIKTAARLILNDIKSIDTPKKYYPDPSDLQSLDYNLKFVPESLQLFLRNIFSERNADLKMSSVGQTIIQAARPRVLIAPLQIGLGVQMHHHFASKFLVDTLNKLGFSSSYTEVQKFEQSAAASQGADLPELMNGHFTQFVADNVDHNIRTIDGLNTFHGMGIIACITPGLKYKKAVPRISVTTEDLVEVGKIHIKFYKQENNAFRSMIFEPLPAISDADPTRCIDMLYKSTSTLKTPRAGWSGMMQTVQISSHPGKSTVYFLPMIDLNPSDMSCIYSTLLFVCKQASKGHFQPILTFDQPLYWKAMNIIANEPVGSDLKRVVLRLGGFHIEMSYLGSIGRLMDGSGLKQLLEVVYAANTVDHMLTGKAVCRAIRGHFLIDDTLNAMLISQIFNIQLPEQVPSETPEDIENIDNHTSDINTIATTSKKNCNVQSSGDKQQLEEELFHAEELYEALTIGEVDIDYVRNDSIISILENKIGRKKDEISKSRTAKLWLQYMAMLDILRRFLKAERTGNWKLHLQSVKEMLPYFAAAGHNLYVKSAYMYLQQMGKLETDHPDVYRAFNKGYHVVRRSDRFWAGLSSDLVIEQVLMKSVKSTGGMTRGRGMSEAQRAQWLLSMPSCSDINSSMQTITSIEYKTSEQHVESSQSRTERDYKDKMKLLAFLQERNPLDLDLHDSELRNIETGVEADSTVNSDSAKEVGSKVIASMTGKNVLDYNFKRTDQAVTMGTKSTVKIDGDSIHVDPQLLFQRLLAAADRLVEDQAEIFSYELCSIPSSLFEPSGLFREADKPSLANAIWNLGDCSMEETIFDESTQHVLDGGSLIQRIPWTYGASFSSICNLYAEFISSRYTNVTVVFDGYPNGPTTKDCTHLRRTHGKGSAKVKFSVNTPCKTKKEHFLSNCENKQNFINMLGQCLQENDIHVQHATGDADLLIVQTAINYTETNDTVIIGEDTDLLVLMCYHYDTHKHNLFFVSGTSKCTRKIVKRWDIKKTKVLLGDNICRMLPFLHSVTGCDTTSRMFGVGKGVALKKLINDGHLKQQALLFNNNLKQPEVIKSGEMAICCLYNGSPSEGLDSLRFRRFANKVMTSTTFVQVHTLPLSSAAASYHSLRVYLQVQTWIGNGDSMEPLEWGWDRTDNMLLPIKTHLQPAPDDLLKIIRCQCKSNCDSKRCTCRKHGLECSSGCRECQGISCSNAQEFDLDIYDDE